MRPNPHFSVDLVTFTKKILYPIQDEPFRECSRIKICRTYPTMMQLGTVIPDLNKIQKMYKSRDAPLIGNQQLLLNQEIQI